MKTKCQAFFEVNRLGQSFRSADINYHANIANQTYTALCTISCVHFDYNLIIFGRGSGVGGTSEAQAQGM